MDEEIFNTLQYAIQEAQTRLDARQEEHKNYVYAELGLRYYDIVTNRDLRASHKKELLGDLQEDARIFRRRLENGDQVVRQEQNVIRILSELQPLMDPEEDDEGPREAKPVPPKWRSFKNNQ